MLINVASKSQMLLRQFKLEKIAYMAKFGVIKNYDISFKTHINTDKAI